MMHILYNLNSVHGHVMVIDTIGTNLVLIYCTVTATGSVEIALDFS